MSKGINVDSRVYLSRAGSTVLIGKRITHLPLIKLGLSHAENVFCAIYELGRHQGRATIGSNAA